MSSQKPDEEIEEGEVEDSSKEQKLEFEKLEIVKSKKRSRHKYKKNSSSSSSESSTSERYSKKEYYQKRSRSRHRSRSSHRRRHKHVVRYNTNHREKSKQGRRSYKSRNNHTAEKQKSSTKIHNNIKINLKNMENKSETIIKPIKNQNEIKTPKIEHRNNSPKIQNLIFEEEKEMSEEVYRKLREERKKKIENIKKANPIFQSNDDPHKLKSEVNITSDIIRLNLNNREDFLLFVEKEREKNLQEEFRLQKESSNNKISSKTIIETSSLNHAGSPSTPDMFTSTPIDRFNDDKKILNIPVLDSHDNSTGYYVPKLNEVLNEQYKIIGVCGKGIFSTVVRVVEIKNNKEYALKIIRAIDVMLMSGEKERNFIKKLNDADKNDKSNIIRLVDSFDFKRHICMVFELYEMNLRDLIKSKSNEVELGLPLNIVRSYAQQLLFAFDLVHKFKIIHADFKPDNAVVNKSLDIVKLCDFGSALLEDEAVITSELVSRFYRAPEIFLGCHYDTKIDIWSIGCTLYELYTGKILFPGRHNNEMIKLIMQTKGKISPKILKRGQYSNLYFNETGDFLSLEIDQFSKKEFIKEVNMNQYPSRDLLSLLKSAKPVKPNEEKNLLTFRDFLEKCLHLDPNKRFSALEGLTHEFIGMTPVCIFNK